MSTGLTETQLRKMRALQEQFLPDRCDIHRPIRAKNIAGSRTETDTVAYTNLPCEATAKVLRQLIEHVGGGQIESAVRWNVVLPYGTDVHLNDTIWVTAAGTLTVSQYEVNGVLTTESWESAVVAQCLRVE